MKIAYKYIIACIIILLPLQVHASNETTPDKKQMFEWSASATLTSNYIWRGLYCGGPSLQADATISYYGFFANMWWNVGASDWAFSAFNPELDLSIGFSQWGLSIYYIHIYYFDHYADGSPSRFFDMQNHAPGGGGTTGEWRIAYRVSDRIPLSILVGLRTFGRDGYYVDPAHPQQMVDASYAGEKVLKRAYSTYIELGYDVDLKKDWMLNLRLGMTPAKSLYTGFAGDFAICHIGAQLTKTWALSNKPVTSKHGKTPYITAFAHLMLNPWQVNKHNLILPVANAGDQKLNLAAGCTVSL